MKTAKVVFLGGGHANVLAMLHLSAALSGKSPRPLLISDSDYSPYSGMLPGYIGGHYRRGECFIDLAALSRSCGFDFLRARAAAINADTKTITLDDGGIINYDVLSVNTGSIRRAPFLSPQVCAVKPIDPFMKWLAQTKGAPTVIIGAGAAGAEIALSMPPHGLTLIGRRFLPGYPPQVCDAIRRLLHSRGIAVCEREVAGEDDMPKNGRMIVATGAEPPLWLSHAGGAKTTGGWLHINRHLQSLSHDNIFAAGDCAHCDDWQVQKSGVVAVRQAPLLAHNILAATGGGRLREWHPPRSFLAILGDGAGGAFAIYGRWHYYGKAALRFKRFLDLRFMRRANKKERL
ncbi:MAG: FAD-dependent oxidoreductase [Gammaproteobacteria bacterium]